MNWRPMLRVWVVGALAWAAYMLVLIMLTVAAQYIIRAFRG